MRKRKGFTLVELLTVISIIVILLAISLPILNSVRRKGRAVVCMSNLRQWGMVYKMYTDEFDGKLPLNFGEFAWYYPIRNYYYNNNKLLMCPMAKKPSNPEGINTNMPFGGTYLAWGRFAPPDRRPAWDTYGSYGMNHWAYKPENFSGNSENPSRDQNQENNQSSGSGGYFYHYESSGDPDSNDYKFSFSYSWSASSPSSTNINEESYETNEANMYWNSAYEKNSNNIPLIVDCAWVYALFDEKTPPPHDDAIPKMNFIGNYPCIDRHDGGINMLFMDFSTRKVGLKELWTIKWHKQFNTAGPWTKAGGVLPENWPKWMCKYKDY